MPANNTLVLTALDFDDLKQNFINFAKTNTRFKDANYEGANINELIDLLSYNSRLLTFYGNMIFAEGFLDSAQKDDTIISHAKELNYLPTSAKSSVTNINFTISTNNISSPFVIPKGTSFTGRNANGSFNFTTSQTYNILSTNNVFSVSNLQIYEGSYTNDVFIVDSTDEDQQFLLSNKNIDIDSLTIVVTENSSNTVFNRVNTLYNLNSNSNVYFLQAAQDRKYEILFGDNLFGRVPVNGSLVTANYRITNGSKANYVKALDIHQNLGAYNNGIATVSAITVNIPSSSGSDPQNKESIRFNAPRYFAAQERAVAADDWKSLILAKYNGQIRDVNVYGGELLNPKRYGSRVACLKPTTGDIVPDYIKNSIINYFQDLNMLPYTLILTNPDYFYLQVSTEVNYDENQTTLSDVDIKADCLTSMINYFQNNNQSFNTNFRFSKFCEAIDDTDNSILSNDTTVRMIKRIDPIPNVSTTYIVNFNNPGYQVNYPLELIELPPSENSPTLYSSYFTYVDNNNISYPNSILRDDNYGKLVVFNILNKIVSIVNDNIGSIDYSTGAVQINNLNISDHDGNFVNLYYNLKKNDISITKDQILNLDPNDITIEVNEE